MKQFMVIIFFLGSTFQVDGQIWLNNEIVNRAKDEIRNQLIDLKDSLDLNRSEVRIRRFNLEPCQEQLTTAELRSLTPAGEFEIVEGCPGPLYYDHITSQRGSYYTIRFFFDSDGSLIKKNVLWTLVIP